MKVIDLTHTIKENMPVYPGTEPPSLTAANSYAVDGFKETLLRMFSHTGTHIDPPAHLYPDGKTLDAFPAEQFVGRALVVDCTAYGEGEAIPLSAITRYGHRAEAAEFLLFSLGWDEKWGTDGYFGDYPCLSDEAMDYILAKDYKGIGFDVIGLDPIADTALVRHHRLFAEKNILNIENLTNLRACGEELFTFVCLPLKWENSDGAPARAIAILD